MAQNKKESYAADIESYEGAVPVWLIIVYVSVASWGLYYLVKYWGGPGASG
ncbi:MAG: hypothetical protein WA133_03715 [Syntrophales bacterium]